MKKGKYSSSKNIAFQEKEKTVLRGEKRQTSFSLSPFNKKKGQPQQQGEGL